MKKLKRLKKDSTIGIIAPSYCDDKESILKNISNFETLGYKIKLGKHIFDKYGYLAGKDTDRVTDLLNMFLDKNIDGIVCYRGGFGSSRIINELDLNILKKNPKIFCGYSDITILLNYISTNCDFPCFHSPMINSKFSDNHTSYYFNNLLNGSIQSYNLTNFNKVQLLNPKNFSGRLCGGNLSIINSSLGTSYEIDTNNKILLLEEVDEKPYVIDRLLTQLINCNKIINCTGIIIGHFTDCKTPSENSFSTNQIILDKLLPLDIPIIYNFPAGHDYPNITLPIGAYLKFNLKENILKICNDLFF